MSVGVFAAEIGGAHTRAVVLDVDADGSVSVRASSSGPCSSSLLLGEPYAKRVWESVLDPLKDDASGIRVDVAVLSCEGPSAQARAALAAAGVGPAHVIDNLASGVWSATRDGTAVVVATGEDSRCVRFVHGEAVDSRGGHGWWLGGEGSAAWLGRALLRMALSDVEEGLLTPVVSMMAGTVGTRELTREDLLGFVYAEPARVAALSASLAPLVGSLQFESRVRTLVADAAAHLAALVPDCDDPVVFMGSLSDSVVGDALARLLPGRRVVRVPSTLAGAAALGARRACEYGLLPGLDPAAVLEQARAFTAFACRCSPLDDFCAAG